MITEIYTGHKGKPEISVHGTSAKDSPVKVAKAYKEAVAELNHQMAKEE